MIRDETRRRRRPSPGVDLKAQVGRTTELRGEAATGGRGGIGEGQAFLAEVEHHGAALDLLAYARQQDRAFGVGQQNLVEAGTRKFGFDGRVASRPTGWSLTGIGLAPARSSTAPARATAGEARLEYRRDTGTRLRRRAVRDRTAASTARIAIPGC